MVRRCSKPGSAPSGDYSRHPDAPQRWLAGPARVEGRHRHPRHPGILLSIVDQKDLGYRLGAFDYLLKPFDREAILAALRRISPAHHRLLVVDDDPHVMDLVRQLLEDQPYEIAAAVDGQAALEAMAQRQTDVILLDLLMPHLDGFGVLEYLHHTPRYRDIPVIVLTAKTCTAEEQALLHTRVRTVIQKQGLERDRLLQEVRAALLAYRTATEEHTA